MTPRTQPPQENLRQRVLAGYPVEAPGRATLVKMTLGGRQWRRLVDTLRSTILLYR